MQIFCHWFHSWMIDPIFAAPRRQEGFASEKQKLLEDCRRRLSKMAMFSKGERDAFFAAKTTAGNKSMTSNQSSWHKWKLGRIVWLWHIQFAGLFVGTCISRSYLEKLWEVVQMWNFNIPWNYQKAVWLHFFSLNCTGWCQVSAQMSKCQRKSEVELEQLDICFSFPVDSWLNGFENTASMNKLLEAFSSSRPHSLCSHEMSSLYGGDVWRWSQRKKEVRKKLYNIDSWSNSRSMNWAPGCAAMIRVPVSLGGTAEPRMMWFIYGRCKGACFSNRHVTRMNTLVKGPFSR